MEEIWKDIEGYEGLYQVSNLGRVKSLNYKRSGKEGILTPTPIYGGYMHINLYKNGKPKPYLIHRLVAQSFIPNPNNLPEVNHKDENKENNSVDNLEWCTSKYNANHGTRNKRVSENNKGKNPNIRKVICVTTGEIFDCIKDAEEKYGVANQNITACCRGRQKSAGKHPITKEKLVWEYV